MNSNLVLPDLRALIFDLDGVIWRGQTPIAGAAQNLQALREHGVRCFFATNNSSRSQQHYAERLQQMNIVAAPETIITSAVATGWHLEAVFSQRDFSAYVVGEDGIRHEVERVGGQILPDDDEDTHADIVVVGLDRKFSYDILRTAQQHILRGATFIATNTDATFPTESGVVPGAGSVVAAIATAANQTPLVIGKPEPAMLTGCIERFGLEAPTTAMVGDRLDTDIACAHRAQIAALWVATGVHSRDHAENATGEQKPDVCFDDLSQLCAAIIGK